MADLRNRPATLYDILSLMSTYLCAGIYQELLHRDRDIRRHWPRPEGTSLLFDPEFSWLDTIEQTRPILQEKAVAGMTQEDRWRIWGYHYKGNHDYNYGFLGSLKGNGRIKKGINENTDNFLDMVLSICRDEALWHDQPSAIEGVVRIGSLEGCAVGFASRLGAILRPDLLVSVNSANSERLATLTGIAKTRLTNPRHRCRGYRELMDIVWGCNWFSDRPTAFRDAREQRCWEARCALLDLFMYREFPASALPAQDHVE